MNKLVFTPAQQACGEQIKGILTAEAAVHGQIEFNAVWLTRALQIYIALDQAGTTS